MGLISGLPDSFVNFVIRNIKVSSEVPPPTKINLDEKNIIIEKDVTYEAK